MSDENDVTEPPLSAETMVALGFRPLTPLGKPTEPWWGHDELCFAFYDGRPTAKQLLDRITARGIAEGEANVRRAIREALQV